MSAVVPKPPKFDEMLGYLVERSKHLKDRREGANKKYKHIRDFVCSAFSVFYLQCPSFLAYQQQIEKTRGENNARNMFRVEEIPSDNHIRDILDEVSPQSLMPVYDDLFSHLQDAGVVERFRSNFEHQLLIPIDGTQFYSSKKMNCGQCYVKEHTNKDGVVTQSYSHSMVTPVLAKPGSPYVLPLKIEFVLPQDGAKKQDCEIKASKRWLAQEGSRLSALGSTVLGDDLYCHEPFSKQVLSEELHFIWVCKESSHPTLYNHVKAVESLGGVKTLSVKRWTGKRHEIDHYRWTHQVPMTEAEDALKVNWFELSTQLESGETFYYNAFVTDHPIDENNIQEAVEAARCRWKVENENNNTLKTKGYHLEHNFGHGQKHLACTLATLNILAFYFHTVLEMCCENYQSVRSKLGARKKFFEHIRSLMHYLCFKGWDRMIAFIQKALEIGPPKKALPS